jgi:hypothetical protein
VPAKAPEILVHHGGIEECKKAERETSIQSLPVGVKVVEVVLKTQPFPRHAVRVKYTGDQATALLFGGESFRQ